PAVQQALSMVKQNGKVVEVAIFEKPPEIQLNNLVIRGITLFGSWAWVPEELQQSLDLIGTGKIDRKPLISHRFPLESASEAYETQLNTDKSMKVMITP
ncbi:MAG: zinc-binding dehydrogenase, partial [Desulfobacterales bacterium]|nr:zinc-binding dehydrogenase [Desulfobacterales bacterium]